MQMLLSAAIAVPLRANLPISIGLVWLTNPITMPAVFFTQYKIGTMLLGAPERSMPMELSFNWLMSEIHHIWQPLLLGALLMGIVLGAIGYGGTMLYWRIWALRFDRNQIISASAYNSIAARCPWFNVSTRSICEARARS